MTEAKDFQGSTVKLGDRVVFMQIKYRTLMEGVVIKITPMTFLIEHERDNYGCVKSRQFHNQVVLKL